MEIWLRPGRAWKLQSLWRNLEMEAIEEEEAAMDDGLTRIQSERDIKKKGKGRGGVYPIYLDFKEKGSGRGFTVLLLI